MKKINIIKIGHRRIKIYTANKNEFRIYYQGLKGFFKNIVDSINVGDIAGRYNPQHRSIKIRKHIGKESTKITLFHEIGHAICHSLAKKYPKEMKRLYSDEEFIESFGRIMLQAFNELNEKNILKKIEQDSLNVKEFLL